MTRFKTSGKKVEDNVTDYQKKLINKQSEKENKLIEKNQKIYQKYQLIYDAELKKLPTQDKNSTKVKELQEKIKNELSKELAQEGFYLNRDRLEQMRERINLIQDFSKKYLSPPAKADELVKKEKGKEKVDAEDGNGSL